MGCAELARPQWDWLAACDVDDFSAEMYAQRFPSVEFHHGPLEDIDLPWTRYIGAEVLVAGTPCQAFSIAGGRRSLDDERGNVTLSFVRMCHELRRAGSLRTVVWENVPGVLSLRDNAFGCFLGGLVGGGVELVAPRGKWPSAGMAAGPCARVAWRVLDAQYFGLAQRRKRVFLVADLGPGGVDPAKILFEPKGMPGDFEPGREAGAGIAGRAGEGFAGCNERVTPPILSLGNSTGGNRSPGMTADDAGALVVEPGAFDMAQITSKTNRASVVPGAPPPTLNSEGRAAVIVPQPLTVAVRGRGEGPRVELRGDGKANAVLGSGGGRGGVGAGAIAVNARQDPIHGDRSPPLDTDGSSIAVSADYVVRKLTPRECERLQGAPDDHTDIPWRGKEAPDGRRYKAIGNAMAVNVMAWILARLEADAQ